MSSAAPAFAPDISPRFPEISTVRTVRDIEEKDVDGIDRIIPAGTTGAVVLAHSTGRDYVVEVGEPYHALIHVSDDDLVAL